MFTVPTPAQPFISLVMMTALVSAALLSPALINSSLSAADKNAIDFGSLQFVSPASAAAVTDTPHGRLLIYWCAQCPTARGWMTKTIAKVAQAYNEAPSPLQIICISPNGSPETIKNFADSIGLRNVHLAYDPVNKKNIGLKNIYQVHFMAGKGGNTQLSYSFRDVGHITEVITNPDKHSMLGSYRYDASSITDDNLRRIWWGLEGHMPGARKALAKRAKRARPGKPIDDQILSLAAAITTEAQAALDQALAGEDNIDTFEALEAALKLADGFINIKESRKRLKAMSRDDTMKQELRARIAYKKCLEWLSAKGRSDQDKGRQGLNQLAEQFADTKYGAAAATKLENLPKNKK